MRTINKGLDGEVSEKRTRNSDVKDCSSVVGTGINTDLANGTKNKIARTILRTVDHIILYDIRL